MKNWLLAALVALVALNTLPTDAEAKRLGGGGSAGIQRSMPSQPSQGAGAIPAKPAPAPTTQPGQPAGAQQAQPGMAANAPAAAPKRNWMGPIAGLAAGLGIAALMSHLGLGEAFGNFLMMALLGVAIAALVFWLMRRFGGAKARQGAGNPGLAHAGAASYGSGQGGAAQVAWPAPAPADTMQRSAVQETSAAASFGHAAPGSSALMAAPASGAPGLPADFDQAGFERIAKMIFIRMQAANDSGDLNDLRSFTTPEMFAHIKLELQERGAVRQETDVVEVAAQVLDLVREDDRDIVSVRFHGRIREEVQGPVEPFDEIWHLTQPRDGSRSWAIAGIQQSR